MSNKLLFLFPCVSDEFTGVDVETAFVVNCVSTSITVLCALVTRISNKLLPVLPYVH